MRKDEIQIRGEYLISMYRHKGRAVVTGPAERTAGRYPAARPVYRFIVEFPDSIKDGKSETVAVESRDFSRPWTQEDDDRFQKMMQEQDRIDKIKTRLENFGFPPVYVHRSGEQIQIQFKGEVADRVVEKLTT